MEELSATKNEGRKPQNLRTALVLLSVVAVFFAGVIGKHVFFGG